MQCDETACSGLHQLGFSPVISSKSFSESDRGRELKPGGMQDGKGSHYVSYYGPGILLTIVFFKP